MFGVTLQVATQFKASLVGLAEILMAKEPWYVRCLKPNDGKQPGGYRTHTHTHILYMTPIPCGQLLYLLYVVLVHHNSNIHLVNTFH